MHRHRVDAVPDPDPTFHFDADPDSDRHQNNADPNADRTPSFHKLENWNILFLLLFTLKPVYNIFLFSSLANVSWF